jgi:hypothetical protein
VIGIGITPVPVFAELCRLDKDFKKEKPGKNARLSAIAPPSGRMSNRFYSHLKQIYSLKPVLPVIENPVLGKSKVKSPW